MPRETFQQALDDLRAAILNMGELVVERLQTALEAYETGEEEIVRQLLRTDDLVNQRYLELEARCIDLFALEQPVAGDLRLVVASFKILTDLERIGDLAVNLAEYAGPSAVSESEVEIQAIGRTAIEMVEDALGAYEFQDPAVCQAIAARDDELDARCQRAGTTLFRDLIAREPTVEPEAVEELHQDVERVLLAIRDLERVGDHAVNIAGRTLYVLEGDPELVY